MFAGQIPAAVSAGTRNRDRPRLAARDRLRVINVDIKPARGQFMPDRHPADAAAQNRYRLGHGITFSIRRINFLNALLIVCVVNSEVRRKHGVRASPVEQATPVAFVFASKTCLAMIRPRILAADAARPMRTLLGFRWRTCTLRSGRATQRQQRWGWKA
jgi:hypothetical protein